MFARRIRLVGALVGAALVVSVPVALAGDGVEEPLYTAPDVGTGEMVNETPGAWFVQLRGSADAFRSEAKDAGIAFSERFVYDKIWNGLSINVSGEGRSRLSRLSSVAAVYPVITFSAPETTSVSPDLATAINMTGADKAQSELGFTGAGVRVAIMDTGVDYDHADLGGSGTDNPANFPNSRVVAGYDFVGDDFNAADPAKLATAPDADPDDCQGHGTHVAGIVGANGATKGVAPGVTFGAYRVFGCEGSTTADIMLAAMERALEDDMDVLNMSIGSAFMTWPQYPTAVGSDALVDAGMVVVASIGNSGANGVYSAGAPGVGNKAIGVASFDNSHVSALTFRTSGNRQVPYLQLSTTTEAPTSGTTPEVAWVGRGCTSLGDTPASNPSGKVALLIRGDCTFQEKYQGAVNAGAVAVVIYNNVTGLFAGGGVTDRGVPGVGISKADGEAVRAEMAAGPVTLTWTADRTNAANPTGGRASSFTSYGMTAELKLKPNIGAPGGLIRAPYPLEKGAYAILSGTSMSSPHVAGGVALLLQARPSTAPGDVKTLFQNSADPVNFGTSPSLLEVVHRQGAGMVDIDDSILSTASVSPSEISLGEGTGGATTLTITNSGSSAVTYTLGHQAAVSTGRATNAPGFFLGNAGVAFSAPSVAVPAGGSATVGVTITKPLSQGQQYGGFIRLSGDNGKVLRVPYAGFSGDYQAIQVLTPTSFGFPWLAKSSGRSFTKQSEGAVFTTKDGDVPYFLLHFEHQARRLELTVLDAATGEPFTGKGALQRQPTFSTEDFLRRNSTSTGFFAWTWDGTLKRNTPGGEIANPVPEGSYKVKVTVLKALGDPSNSAHTETWTSPAFTIDRP